jgi:hypothetical protein
MKLKTGFSFLLSLHTSLRPSSFSQFHRASLYLLPLHTRDSLFVRHTCFPRFLSRYTTQTALKVLFTLRMSVLLAIFDCRQIRPFTFRPRRRTASSPSLLFVVAVAFRTIELKACDGAKAPPSFPVT